MVQRRPRWGLATALEDLNGWDVAIGGTVRCGLRKQNWCLSEFRKKSPGENNCPKGENCQL